MTQFKKLTKWLIIIRCNYGLTLTEIYYPNLILTIKIDSLEKIEYYEKNKNNFN